MRSSRARAIIAAAGVLLLFWALRRTGTRQIAADITRLGWGLALIIALGGLAHVVKTWAWWFTLPEDKHEVSFWRMLGLRLGSEAVGQIGVIGTVLGDGLRVSLLGANIPAASGLVSVALDRALFMLSAAVTIAIGTVAAMILCALPHRIVIATDVFAVVLILLIAAAVVAVKRRMRFISGLARALTRVPRLRTWIAPRSAAIQSLEEQLVDFFHDRPTHFRASLALNFACHAAAVIEVWLALGLLGAHIGFRGALAVEALTKIVNSLGGLNPGNIGTYEGGNMLIGKLFAFGGSTGLALAFARRARAIFWTAAGAFCLVFLSKPGRRSSGPVPNSDKQPPDPNGCAVILADGLFGYCGPDVALPRVGETPVLLRAILGLRKAGFGNIVVVVDRVTGPSAERELRLTRRLPDAVRWIQREAYGPFLADLILRFAACDAGRVAFLAADRIYHPGLLQSLGTWNGASEGLALRTGSKFTGACLFSIAAAKAFAPSALPGTSSIEQLETWVAESGGIDYVEVSEDRWQRIGNQQEHLAAERKLDSWLVKPTDGNFARFNRRFSIPISRQLIRLPISPNMVSLFTLGVSLLSGAYFAMGGYLNMVVGALFGLFASILDGCDGEVARLTLQESEFGCWLETVCDYLYYLFMFAGMTIGLLRSTGARAYLYLGCLLLFGAVMSFVTTAMQRARLTAAGRPEQLLGNWHREAERRRSNPLMLMARHTEFIVRRCFLPYAILFFAVFQIIPVAFILAAAGANVVWPIALYSWWTFPSARNSVAGSAA